MIHKKINWFLNRGGLRNPVWSYEKKLRKPKWLYMKKIKKAYMIVYEKKSRKPKNWSHFYFVQWPLKKRGVLFSSENEISNMGPSQKMKSNIFGENNYECRVWCMGFKFGVGFSQDNPQPTIIIIIIIISEGEGFVFTLWSIKKLKSIRSQHKKYKRRGRERFFLHLYCFLGIESQGS